MIWNVYRTAGTSAKEMIREASVIVGTRRRKNRSEEYTKVMDTLTARIRRYTASIINRRFLRHR